ncbi:MAG: MerR family transcriptional regulator [Candidatus Limnocylindrales bacterium]|jgi:DNA-binding transcriptional MerR regulator
MDDTSLPIRDFAKRTGLSPHTLRYYERIGLLDPVERAASGHRRYSAQDATWIEFLTRLRATGMSIRQMQRFAALRREGAATVRERRELLEAHQSSVETRLGSLEANLAAITEKIHHYRALETTDGTRSKRPPIHTRAGEAR